MSGTVYDPAGRVPFYTVVVFVPNDKLEPLKNGASCETCDGMQKEDQEVVPPEIVK